LKSFWFEDEKMKILYFGGQKSGKTSLAIKKVLKLSGDKKPYYIATYLDNYDDKQMKKRIKDHQLQRSDDFITIEEGFDLKSAVQKCDTVCLIDCLSMWILNSIERKEEEIFKDIEELMQLENDIVFILNDVSSGVIPIDSISREFVDLSGIVGQIVAKNCDEVIKVEYGIENKIK